MCKMVRNEETLLKLSNDFSEIRIPILDDPPTITGKIYLGSAGPCMMIKNNGNNDNGGRIDVSAGIVSIPNLSLYIDASNDKKYSFINQVNQYPTFKQFTSRIEHIKIPVQDSRTDEDQEIMLNHLCFVTHRMNENVKKGCSVYVHCRMGMQRSAAIVAAYFIRYYDYDVNQALKYVQDFRPIAFGGLLSRNSCRTLLQCASFKSALTKFHANIHEKKNPNTNTNKKFCDNNIIQQQKQTDMWGSTQFPV